MGLPCDHNVDDEPVEKDVGHLIEFVLEATSINDFAILASLDDTANLREDIVNKRKRKVGRPVKEIIEFFEHVDKSKESDLIKAQLFKNEFYNSWRKSSHSLGRHERRHVGQ